jgi:hypothetical protein
MILGMFVESGHLVTNNNNKLKSTKVFTSETHCHDHP